MMIEITLLIALVFIDLSNIVKKHLKLFRFLSPQMNISYLNRRHSYNIYYIPLFISTNIPRYVYWGLRLFENWNKFCGKRQVIQHNWTTEGFGCIILHSKSHDVKKTANDQAYMRFGINHHRVIIGTSFSRIQLGPGLKAV